MSKPAAEDVALVKDLLGFTGDEFAAYRPWKGNPEPLNQQDWWLEQLILGRTGREIVEEMDISITALQTNLLKARGLPTSTKQLNELLKPYGYRVCKTGGHIVALDQFTNDEWAACLACKGKVCACGCGGKTRGGEYCRGHYEVEGFFNPRKTEEQYVQECKDGCEYEDRGFESLCFIWKGKVNGVTGYPTWSGYLAEEHGVPSGTITRHRLLFMILHGIQKLARDQHIDHMCDQKDCLRPDHLRVLSQTDNIRRGRSRVTADDVRSIRARAEAGESVATLAKQYGYSFNGMDHIVSGRNWKLDEGVNGNGELP